VRAKYFASIFILTIAGSPTIYTAPSQQSESSTGGRPKLEEVEKVLKDKPFEAFLNYIKANSTPRLPKVYSSEFCAERLKGEAQAEALRNRKLAETILTGLKSYQKKLAKLSVDEFAKAVNQLLDLRDWLSEPGYANISLQLVIENVVTLRITERVVAHNEDLKILHRLMERNNQWKHEWKTVCQMIEEEENKKQFDYAAMERMTKANIYRPFRNLPPSQLIPLYHRYDPEKAMFGTENSSDAQNFLWLFQKRNVNGFLHFLFMEEFNGRTCLPGLILFKERGGNFEGKWKDDFDKRMADYLNRTDLVYAYVDADNFQGLVELATNVSKGDETPFLFDVSR